MAPANGAGPPGGGGFGSAPPPAAPPSRPPAAGFGGGAPPAQPAAAAPPPAAFGSVRPGGAGGFAPPAPAPGGFAPPAPAPGGFAPPPPAGGSFAPPPPAGGGFAPPPPAGGGFAPPPPAPGGFTPPPPGAPPPPPPMAGFGGGPAPGSFAPPPPGSAPGPPPGAMMMPGGGVPGAALGGYGAPAARALDPFEALEPGGDPAYFPRPTGDAAATAGAPAAPPLPGSCDGRFMRLTVNAIPAQQATRARFQLPIGAVVHPLAGPQEDVPVIPLGPAGIVRCKRCRTYVNPFVAWVDGGRRFQCNVCAALNDVPAEYYSSLDPATGARLDAGAHPELSTGSVEWVAPAEYMVRAPMPPSFFFVIDVSATAVGCGMVGAAVAAIKACLDRLPGDDRTQVGFLTFDTALHFYNLRAGATQPQMVVVPEVAEPFAPLPDDLLVNLADSRSVVDALLDALPGAFAAGGGAPGDAATGPALQAAFMAMSHVGGKLLLFQAAPPAAGAGKVRARDGSAAAWGTDAEPRSRVPEDPFFKKYAAEASRAQIAVDVFSFAPGFTDLASLGALPKYTCGQLYYYPGFSAGRDAARVAADVERNLTRPTGWEAVMRIRCSKGLRISAFHGHFFVRSTDLLALPQVDPDKAFAVQIAHEEGVVTGPAAFIQCALLYTSSCGERRIRVHTAAVSVVPDLPDLYRAVDGGAMAALLAKLAVEKAYGARLDETRAAIQHKVGLALREYRLMHAAGGRGGALPHTALIFPPGLRYLALWTLGISKCAALRGGPRDVAADERTSVGLDIMAAPVSGALRLAYPALLPLHDPSGEWGRPRESDGAVLLPAPAPLATAALDPAGAYLLDNGRVFVLWLGRSVRPDFMAGLFGLDPSAPLPADAMALSVEPERPGSPASARVCAVLRALRAGRPTHAPCFVVRQGSPAEAHVVPYFVEDRGPGGPGAAPSYADFAAALQKAVLAKA